MTATVLEPLTTYLSGCLQTRWLWVQVLLQSLKTSDFIPASNKEFLHIQATIECGLTLRWMRGMIRTYTQNYIVITVNLLQIIFKQS